MLELSENKRWVVVERVDGGVGGYLAFLAMQTSTDGEVSSGDGVEYGRLVQH